MEGQPNKDSDPPKKEVVYPSLDANEIKVIQDKLADILSQQIKLEQQTRELQEFLVISSQKIQKAESSNLPNAHNITDSAEDLSNIVKRYYPVGTTISNVSRKFDPYPQRISEQMTSFPDIVTNYRKNTTKRKNPTANIWHRGDRAVATASGAAFLGGLIGQIPGAIAGAVFGALFGLFVTPKTTPTK